MPLYRLYCYFFAQNQFFSSSKWPEERLKFFCEQWTMWSSLNHLLHMRWPRKYWVTGTSTCIHTKHDSSTNREYSNPRGCKTMGIPERGYDSSDWCRCWLANWMHCAKDSWKVINSQRNGLYTVKSILGWTVNGPRKTDATFTGKPVVIANRHSVTSIEEL